jgi:hypothetical protein
MEVFDEVKGLSGSLAMSLIACFQVRRQGGYELPPGVERVV